MQKTKQHRAQIQLRDINWEQDFHSLLQIEQQSFARPWSAQQFARFANSHDSRGLIAVQNGTVVGYLLYETSMALNHIAHIAVAPGHRSQGIGSTMIFALKDANPCHALSLNVRRSNVQAQRALRESQFCSRAYQLATLRRRRRCLCHAMRSRASPGRAASKRHRTLDFHRQLAQIQYASLSGVHPRHLAGVVHSHRQLSSLLNSDGRKAQSKRLSYRALLARCVKMVGGLLDC
jgi:ribosomal protein S18 acetylase RimI-like enzyme